jgi:hypothetical protein
MPKDEQTAESDQTNSAPKQGRRYQRRQAASDAVSNGLLDAQADLQRDSSYDLSQPSADGWETISNEVKLKYYAQAESDFFRIVDDYLEQANDATNRYKKLTISHSRWHFWTILATGGLAAINVAAVFNFLNVPVSNQYPQ